MENIIQNIIQNIIVIAILVIVIGGAVWYIMKEKKKGVKCIGCPAASTCASRAAGKGCGCGGTDKSEQ